MKKLFQILFFTFLLGISAQAFAQKVAVIYSGGGSACNGTNYTSNANSIANGLANTGHFTSVTGIWYQGGSLTQAELNSYDAVMVVTNCGHTTSNGLDLMLKNYVDQGGGVGVFLFANASIRLGNNWNGTTSANSYNVLTPSGQSFGTTNFGAIAIPNHPALNIPYVINTSTWSIGNSFRSTATTLHPSAFSIASFSDGGSFIAARENVGPKNARLIDCALFPDGLSSNTNANQLFTNVLKWLCGAINVTGNTCLPTNSLNFSLTDNSSSPIVSYTWDFGDGTSSTSPTPIHAFTSAGTFNVQLSITRQDASTTSYFKSVSISALPTTANAGADIVVNLPINFTSMAANTPTVGTGAWTKISGPNTPTITSASSPTTSISGLVAGNYVFRWTISNQTCNPSTDDISVVVASTPSITTLSPNPVTSGQTLTITGTNFTGATSVTINGTSVPFTVASSTSITVVVPTGTTSGKVIVTTPGGTADGTVQIGSNTTAAITTGWTNAWQTLSTSSAGYLKSVTLKLDNTDANNDYGLYLELYNTDADPSSANPWNKFTGTPLETSATLTMLKNTASGEVTFTFPGTVKFNANSTYYVRLKEAAGNPSGTGLQGINKLSSTSGTTNGGAGNNFGTLYYKFSMAPHLTVINPANISVTSNLTPFSSCEGLPSAPQSFTATGTQLTAPLSILAPTGFEISTNETTGFSSTLTLNPFSAVAVPGSVEYCYISPDASSGQTTVYVDMRQFPIGVLPEEVGYLQLLDLYTGPATFLFSDVGGWARYRIPVDLTNTSASAYTANFRSNGYGETNITVDFQFSSGNTINLPIYVRLSAAATGSPMDNVTLSSTGATSVNVAVSGTVNAKPPVPAVSNVTACQDLSIPNTFLSALTATGTNLLWYTSATGGVGSANAPIPQASTPGTTSYWVTQTNANGCESDRAQIDVLINPIPTFNQPPNQTIVNGTAIQPINFVGTVPNTTFSWTILNAGWGIPTTGVGNIPAYVVDANLAGSPSAATTIIVTPTANGCVGAPRNILLTILSPNSAPTNISLSKTNLFEANALGATVGNLSSTDPDVGDTHTYALVGGSGGGDNASFTIVGNQLKANAVFNFATKRLYAVRIRSTDAGGLPFEKEFLISISKTPIVLGTGNVPSTKKQTAASANPAISKGYASYLTVTGENLTGYSWSPGTGLSANNIANPVASPAQTTTYNVTVTNSFGSTTVVPITITVLLDYNVTPNNLLTPNGDGINDTWAIENIASYPNNEVKIVDKAGRIVFTQKGYSNTWDGANLIPDTYYYIIIFGPDVAPKKGFITIIR